jgi:flagellar basal body-associated protein FliL
VAAVLLMAGAMTAVFVLGRSKHDSPQSKEPAQTSSASAADPLSESPAKDDQFLWRLKLQGLQLQRSNDAAISDARRVCSRFTGGEGKHDVVQDVF